MFESNVTEGGQIMQSVKVTFCNMKMLLQHCKKNEKKKNQISQASAKQHSVACP